MVKPIRTFIGVEGQPSVGDAGPDAIKRDIDNLTTMFDPTSQHGDGSPGGVGSENIQNGAITEDKLVPGGITDALIGDRTANDLIVSVPADTGTITQLFSWVVKVIKSIIGGASWRSAPPTSLTEVKSHMTSTNTSLVTIGNRLNVLDAHTHPLATQSSDGFMGKNDKIKLDGVAVNANNYVHPTTKGNKHIPEGGATGQYLRNAGDGIASWANFPVATQSIPGYMSTTDKTKLDGIAAQANNYVHPVSSGNRHIPEGGGYGKYLGYASEGNAAWMPLATTVEAINVTTFNLGPFTLFYDEAGDKLRVDYYL